jgi:hypothetical protein
MKGSLIVPTRRPMPTKEHPITGGKWESKIIRMPMIRFTLPVFFELGFSNENIIA